MTILEALHKIDSIKPNVYGQTEKIGWLSSLDGMIKREIIDTHQGGETILFKGYTEEDLNAKLLVPEPYDELYIFWLGARIDYWTGEFGKYNNSISMFNKAYEEFEKYYNRTRMPVRNRHNYFGNHYHKEGGLNETGLIKISIKES